MHDLCDELGLRCQVDITAGAARAWTNVDDRKHLVLAQTSRTALKITMVGGPGVKPGFAASDAAVLFDYTTHPLELAPGIQPGPLR